MKKDDVLNLVSKKYSGEMLRSLAESPKRFKDLADACRGEKMRAQRLREFEDFRLIKVNVERVGRRPVSFYELSDVGKRTLKLSEDIRNLQRKAGG
jgi:DNA-binding HxlR family transcriptional regulator